MGVDLKPRNFYGDIFRQMLFLALPELKLNVPKASVMVKLAPMPYCPHKSLVNLNVRKRKNEKNVLINHYVRKYIIFPVKVGKVILRSRSVLQVGTGQPGQSEK